MRVKIFSALAAAILLVLIFLFGCTQTEQSKTAEEIRKEEDAMCDRVIYLTPNETYNYSEQLKYEEKDVQGLSYEYQSVDFSVSSDGVITATAEPDDIVGGQLAVNQNGALLEKVMIRVVNMQKYGTSLMTLDVGRLYGKSVVFFGDSITHNWAKYPNGDLSVVNDTDSLGYNHIPMLNEICKFSSVVNAAWSGGTVSYVPSSAERFTYKSFPVCADSAADAVKSADYAFVMYGTNDFTDQLPLGQAQDTMTTDSADYSFWAGVNYGIESLQKSKPNLKITVMGILMRANVNLGSLKITDYNSALQQSSKAHNVKYMEMLKVITAKTLPTLLSDGLHPNEDGYKVITEYILSGK